MNSDQLYDALEACKATSSKKAKLEIVKTMGEARHWLQAAVDPTVAYYVGELPKYAHSGTEMLGPDDETLLRRLADRTYSGKDALQRIEDTMRELTPKSQQVLRRIILKDLRCGVGETIINTAFPGLIPVFPYQRCVLEKDSNMAKWNWADGVIIQLKADGMFANVNTTIEGVSVFSRQGSPFPKGSLGPLEKALYDSLDNGTQTHGELLVYKGDGDLLPRAEGNGILNSLLQGGELPKDHYVWFWAWDQIPIECAVDKGRYEVPYKTRLEALQMQFADAKAKGISGTADVIHTEVVHSRAEAAEIYKEFRRKKLEGVIAKHPEAHWRDGDNKDQVKFKQEVDVDLYVKAILPGDEGKRTEGLPGRLTMATSDDLLEVNVTVKNEKMRAALNNRPDLFVGKVMVVRANELVEPGDNNPLHSLFLPRFVEDTPRMDKIVADTLDQVRGQFEAAVEA